jgi:hypothetical protein
MGRMDEKAHFIGKKNDINSFSKEEHTKYNMVFKNIHTISHDFSKKIVELEMLHTSYLQENKIPVENNNALFSNFTICYHSLNYLTN